MARLGKGRGLAEEGGKGVGAQGRQGKAGNPTRQNCKVNPTNQNLTNRLGKAAVGWGCHKEGGKRHAGKGAGHKGMRGWGQGLGEEEGYKGEGHKAGGRVQGGRGRRCVGGGEGEGLQGAAGALEGHKEGQEGGGMVGKGTGCKLAGWAGQRTNHPQTNLQKAK